MGNGRGSVMAVTGTYTTAPDGSVHLFEPIFATPTFCGMARDETWTIGDETVVGARACVTCYRYLKSAQTKLETIERAREGRQ